jgi:hypothetical protein
MGVEACQSFPPGPGRRRPVSHYAPPTRPTRTNLAIVRRFLEIKIWLQAVDDKLWNVAVGTCPEAWNKITN